MVLRVILRQRNFFTLPENMTVENLMNVEGFVLVTDFYGLLGLSTKGIENSPQAAAQGLGDAKEVEEVASRS
jgi:hypothetical protein